MSRYKVLVDDNFHYQDADARWEHGNYESVEEALAACREIVDRSLEEQYRVGMSAEALYHRYVSFGEDPFIVAQDGTDKGVIFSAWSYAGERCRVICEE